jgi:hypothetical protein
MSYLAPSSASLRSTESIDQGAILGSESQRKKYVAFFCCAYQLLSGHGPRSPYTPLIHSLDDDSLLNIFYLYRPTIFDDDDDDEACIIGGKRWDREQWWYELTHVCQRWRNIILGSASHLRLSLVCTWDTPVADMLAHSPPLPLVVDYPDEGRDISAEDEEGIFLALEQHHRVRRVRFGLPVPNLQKLIVAMDEEYPVLEYLIMAPRTEDKSATLITLPQALHAPHLRHLVLRGIAIPIRSRLLTTAVGIVTLALYLDHPSAYFQPNTLLQWISAMPQLEMLVVAFLFPVPNRDVERQLMHTQIMEHITLPNLRLFGFKSASACLEAVVRRITAPRLEKLFIDFSKQLTFSIPHLLQFMNTSENLRFDTAKFQFSEDLVRVEVYPPDEVDVYALQMNINCWHLDWQVFSMAQISNSLSQMSSTVEHLTFKHYVHDQSSEEHNEVDRNEWRNLLRSFSNAKTLRVDDGLVKQLSDSLRLDDGELPLELLPELQELTYSGGNKTGDAFTSFIDARQNAGRPVTLVRPT